MPDVPQLAGSLQALQRRIGFDPPQGRTVFLNKAGGCTYRRCPRFTISNHDSATARQPLVNKALGKIGDRDQHYWNCRPRGLDERAWPNGRGYPAWLQAENVGAIQG